MRVGAREETEGYSTRMCDGTSKRANVFKGWRRQTFQRDGETAGNVGRKPECSHSHLPLPSQISVSRVFQESPVMNKDSQQGSKLTWKPDPGRRNLAS